MMESNMDPNVKIMTVTLWLRQAGRGPPNSRHGKTKNTGINKRRNIRKW